MEQGRMLGPVIVGTLILIAISMPLANAQLEGPGSGLVGWWKFDEVSGDYAYDSSGNGNTGKLIGSPAWVSGYVDGAISFNGDSDYIRIPQSDTLRNGVKTVALWISISDFLKKYGGVYSWGWTGCSDTYYGPVNFNGGQIVYYQNAAGAIIRSISIAGPNTWKLGEWAHYAIVYNSTGNTTGSYVYISLYKNGVLVGTPYTGTDGLSEACAMRNIGSQEDYPNPEYRRTFPGMMDDYRVYNRALNASEIYELYNQNKRTTTDTMLPSTPTGLTATALSYYQVALSWNPSTDDTGVAGYVIYQGGSPIASVRSGTTYTDVAHGPTGTTYQYTVSPSTTYTYTVAAFDAAGNYSAQSAPTSATTPASTGGPYTLTVTMAGSALTSAYANSFPSGIVCTSGTCSASFPAGTVVALTPYAYIMPDNPNIPVNNFQGWSGAGCSGDGQCILIMDSDKSITATYGTPAPTYTLTVSHTGTGGGTITSSPAGISCASGTCSASFSSGTSVTLSASPASGSSFSGWIGGGCSGTGTCAVTMSSNISVTANFTLNPVGDTTPPTVTAFSIPSASSSLTVPITAFTATDNVGVSGYLLTESASTPSPTAPGWTATAPSSYTFASEGTKTLYAWAKDAVGLVSANLSDSVVITLPSGGIHYIRAGAMGASNGNDWTNAWSSFSSVTWTRGDTYYMASGVYNEAVSISRAVNGTLWIYVKKATAGEHGTETGWSDSYASGQAEINGTLLVLYSYVDVDGVTGSDNSGHGIKVHYTGCDSVFNGKSIVTLGQGADNIHIHHMEIEGCGFGTYDSTDGFYHQNLDTNPSYDIQVDHSWIHDVSRNGITIGSHQGTSYADGSIGFLFENNRIERTGGCLYPDWHGQGVQIYGGTQSYLVFRNNKFIDITGTGYMAFLGGSIHDHVRIYNNIFYSTDLGTFTASPGVITILDASISANNFQIYNNVFHNIDLKGVTNWCGNGTGNELKNNIFSNSRFTYGNVGFTSQYNDYYNNTGFGIPSGEAGQQAEASDPFINSAAHDFHLRQTASAIDNGISLSSVFSTDADGVSRPQGSGWDMGPYEYASSQSCIHESDNAPCDGCVSNTELFAFIDRWYMNNLDVTLKELMEAIGLWKRGC